MERLVRDFLEEQQSKGLLRTLNPLSFLKKGRITVNGKEYINFSSNDYLGLSSDGRLLKALTDNDITRLGTASSRLMTGTSFLHSKLEERIALFKNKPAGMVFNSGYQANVGIISAIFGKGDVIFCDRLGHASIIDGSILSGARLIRFKHNDVRDLESLLHQHRKKYSQALLITETLFSMDGDMAPIKDIADLSRKYDCLYMVDEAHATGIFGKKGSGLAEEAGISDDIDIIMGTFSKALGSFGAYAAVSSEMKDFLVNKCRSFIYSTSLPEFIIHANIAAIEIVSRDDKLRKKVIKNAGALRNGLKRSGVDIKGCSQIIPVITGDNKKTVKISDMLKKEGFWVTPVRPPTVPENKARIRISVTSDHDSNDINGLVSSFSEIIKNVR